MGTGRAALPLCPGRRLEPRPGLGREDRLHLLDVLARPRIVPVPGVPLADATPEVAGRIGRAEVTDPGLLAFVTEAPGGHGEVHIEGCARPGGGPYPWKVGRNVGTLHLKNAHTGAAVGLRLGRAAVAIAQEWLLPGGFLHRLRPHPVLIEAPFAGAPAKDLIGRPGEIAGDARLVRRIPRREIAVAQAEALRVDVHLIRGAIPGPGLPGILRDFAGTLAVTGQR